MHYNYLLVNYQYSLKNSFPLSLLPPPSPFIGTRTQHSIIISVRQQCTDCVVRHSFPGSNLLQHRVAAHFDGQRVRELRTH